MPFLLWLHVSTELASLIFGKLSLSDFFELNSSLFVCLGSVSFTGMSIEAKLSVLTFNLSLIFGLICLYSLIGVEYGVIHSFISGNVRDFSITHSTFSQPGKYGRNDVKMEWNGKPMKCKEFSFHELEEKPQTVHGFRRGRIVEPKVKQSTGDFFYDEVP
jgi:hypothetical protein